MSTYWGYRCRTCLEESPHWYNHGEERLRLVAENIETFKAVTKLPLMLNVSFEFVGVFDEPNPAEFLMAHDGHEIVLANEYGDTKPLKE